MRFPPIPKAAAIVRGGKSIPWTFAGFLDEFIWLDRRWSKDPKFRETYDRIAEKLSEAPEGEVFPMESKDFENVCEVLQDWPPQGIQIMPDITRPTRKMINTFCSAPTEDPREVKKDEKPSESTDEKA